MNCFAIGLSQNYFNSAKIFLLRRIEMADNQAKCFSLRQRAIIKFLVFEKCNGMKYMKYTEECVTSTEK